MDEQRLVGLAQKGDRKALGELLIAHHGACYSFALKLSGRESDAEDICQEAFLQATRDIPCFRAESSFKAWLLRIVRHRALDLSSSARASKRREDQWAMAKSEHSNIGSAETAAELSEMLPAIRAEIAKLEDLYRLPIILHYEQGLSHSEVAAVLEAPAGTVATHISRGVERIRDRMSALGYVIAAPALAQALSDSAQPVVSESLKQFIRTTIIKTASQAVRSAIVAVGVLLLLAGAWFATRPNSHAAASLPSDNREPAGDPKDPPEKSKVAPLLAKLPDGELPIAFTPSPDKKQLALLTFDEVTTHLYVLDLATFKLRKLEIPDGKAVVPEVLREQAAAPAWSNDGQKLFVTLADALSCYAKAEPVFHLDTEALNVGVIDLKSGATKMLTTDGRSHSPLPLPNGSLIFARCASLFTIDAGGANEKLFFGTAPIVREKETTFIWSDCYLCKFPYDAAAISPLTLSADGKVLFVVAGTFALGGEFARLAEESLVYGKGINLNVVKPFKAGILRVDIETRKEQSVEIPGSPTHLKLSPDLKTAQAIVSADDTVWYYLFPRLPRILKEISLENKPDNAPDLGKTRPIDVQLSPDGNWMLCRELSPARMLLKRNKDERTAELELDPFSAALWLDNDRFIACSKGSLQILKAAEVIAVDAPPAPEIAKAPEGIPLPPGMVYVPGGEFISGDTRKRIGVRFDSEDGTLKIKRIEKGSSAERAGLQPGDIITANDRQAFAGNVFTSFRKIERETEELDLCVKRDGKDLEFKIKPEAHGHKATLPGFFIERYAVTNRQYREYLVATGKSSPVVIPANNLFLQPFAWNKQEYVAGRDDFPVVCLTMQEAQAYASWRGFRLPSALEWEKAARGTDGRTYPWGNEFHSDCACTGRGPNMAQVYLGWSGPARVGTYPKDRSPYGVYDMGGNVDQYVDEGTMGGSWLNRMDEAPDLNASYLLYPEKRAMRGNYVGFRCAIGEDAWREHCKNPGKSPAAKVERPPEKPAAADF